MLPFSLRDVGRLEDRERRKRIRNNEKSTIIGEQIKIG
jgi:hypothetical protein